jgi:PAS domain S-box-containing protein
LHELLASLNEAESGRRGYVLSGHTSYWTCHTDKVAQVHAALSELRALFRSNPQQVSIRDRLEPLIFRRLSIFTNSIKAYQANGLNLAEQFQFMEEGFHALQPIQLLVSELVAEETARLEQRQAVQKEQSDGAKGFALIVTLLGLVLSAVLLGLFVRANRQRRQAEEVLRQSYSKLEQRVQERTAELQRNLTERNQAEAALRESEARFRTLAESVPQLVWTCRPDGACDFLSRQWVAYTGRPAEEQLGYGWADSVHPEDRASVTSAWAATIRSGGPFDVEFRIRRADRIYRWFRTRAVPLHDGAGQIIKWIGSNTDVEDYKSSEQRLQTQLDRLNLLDQTTRAIGERQHLQSIFQVVIRSLEEHLPVDFGCVCTCDPLEQSLTVMHVGTKSLMFAADLGLTEQAHIDSNEKALFRCLRGPLVYEADVREAVFPLLQRMAKRGLRSLVIAPLLVENRAFGLLLAARSEPRGFTSGDCEFLRQLSGHVALAAHQAQLYDALQQAYNDLRQSQQRVMQQDRLRALGQMASGIAHDINNAISPVALYTESSLEREPHLSDRARNYLLTIRQAIRDVAETVARMREFYRQREPQLTLARCVSVASCSRSSI